MSSDPTSKQRKQSPFNLFRRHLKESNKSQGVTMTRKQISDAWEKVKNAEDKTELNKYLEASKIMLTVTPKKKKDISRRKSEESKERTNDGDDDLGNKPESKHSSPIPQQSLSRSLTPIQLDEQEMDDYNYSNDDFKAKTNKRSRSDDQDNITPTKRTCSTSSDKKNKKQQTHHSSSTISSQSLQSPYDTPPSSIRDAIGITNSRPTKKKSHGKKKYYPKHIINKRGEGENIQYLVMWHGYDITESTWEPLENVRHLTKLIAECEALLLKP